MAKSLTKQRLLALAERLAERVSHHAYCADHSIAESDLACPSCDDRAAYMAWLSDGGRDFRLGAADRRLAGN